jgi:signal transduction histidine kinase
VVQRQTLSGATKADDGTFKYLAGSGAVSYTGCMTTAFLDRRAWAIAFIAWTVFGTLMMMPSALLGPPKPLSAWLGVLTSIVIVVPMSMAILAMFVQTRNWSSPARYLLVAVLVVVLGFVSSAADAWKGLLLDKWLLPDAPEYVVAHRAVRQSVGFITEFAIIFSLHLVLLHVRDSAARAAELAAARDEAAQLALAAAAAESAATSAKLEALRYQLNPHFLFNTLNAISSSVLTGKPEAAEATLTKLCSFLRATLAASNSGMVAVEDELQTIADYLAIEKARLGDRLRLEFECPPALRDAAVPSFLLQPLVENAIKHGVGATSRTVTLRVEVSAPGEGQLRIEVIDDAQATRVAPIKGTGLGLANIRERLATVFGPSAFLDATPTPEGFRASVTMPLTRVDDEPVYARAAG